jgi:23S rRNA pseudouridine1911/1915/1917 synthase
LTRAGLGHNGKVPRLERTYLDWSRPVRDLTFVVNLPEEGRRLDAVLHDRFSWKSRTRFQAMLERGEVLWNGREAKASQRVRKGDVVLVRLPIAADAPERETADDLVILHEDEHVVVVDKPSGMAAHPVGRIRHGTLINKLHARYRADDRTKDVVPRLGHRLDRDTSGVLLVVKDRRTDQLVTEAFTLRRVRKTYLALVEGVPEAAEGEVDAPIGPAPDGATALHMGVRPDGAPSRSRWRVVRAFRDHALLALEPKTGRTHQLRVHMAHLGHPILCDHLYGDPRPVWRSSVDPSIPLEDDAIVLQRLALHSHRLELSHPITGGPLAIESPLPPDLVAAIEELASLPRPARLRA